jgi:UDP-N-acetylglucosamine 2-epimerase (non-hydrolysing)
MVHTGQNYDYELNKVFFDELEIREPDMFLNVVGDDLGETIGNIISSSYSVLSKTKPDALLVLGDTNSCLCVISAKRLKIPVFHLEAGNRCFDENLPEEINRRIVDHISDVNLCYTEHARRYLYAEGINKERTFVVGSPMAEVIDANIQKINESKVLEKLGLTKGKYILLSAHREENIDIEANFVNLMNSINSIAEEYNIPVIYSTHPRSKKFIDQSNFKFNDNVKKLDPFGFPDYICLQQNALCVVSDSGTLAEESSILKFPAVSIRTSTERPEAIDTGNMVIGNITDKSVLQAIELAISMHTNGHKGAEVPDYMDKYTSHKVIKLIQSYTEIINKIVWRKE